MIGAEARHAYDDDLNVYGQLAHFDAERDDDSPNGTQHGVLVRLGVTYDAFETTSLFADFQYAATQDYQDNGEDYDFYQLTLGGETMLGASDFALTHDLSLFQSQEITDLDGDELVHATATIGVRYYFGGQRSGSTVGTPSVIKLANMFTQFHN